VWHFIDVDGFIITGIVFIIMLCDTEQWRRIVPASPLVLLQAWNTWVHYATFHLPPASSSKSRCSFPLLRL
jgi:methionine sulfoxide reductase catalytic subunit